MTTFPSSYTAIVATGQQLFISHRDGQTQLTIATATAGQQQSQSSSLKTGAWRSAPSLYCTSSGVVLQISAEQGDIWLQLQGQQMQQISAPPVVEADRVTLEPTEAPPSMQPMQPMRMSNLGQPMQMKMGNMEMSMGKPANGNAAKFCAQCGQPVEPSDRFCANCGHQLNG